ncbi:MAG TPA: SRPBCC family protein [Candidatus Aquabacterium excrementipullorum]|nr:SRPBCC family protein [Candidatus Aquabacterium excrementipullorum]
MTDSITLGVSLDCPWDKAYAFLSDPANMPRWASGLGDTLTQEDGRWIAEGPLGRVAIRFEPRNELGVLDHTVELPDGGQSYNPMRLVRDAGGSACVLLFTLLRQPGVSDTQFDGDADWVRKDLAALKGLLDER